MAPDSAPSEDWKLDLETVVAMFLRTTAHARRVLKNLDECGWAVVRKDAISRRGVMGSAPLRFRDGDTHNGWRCECGDLNMLHEAFCYRCGAGPHEPTWTEALCVC